MSDSSDTYIAYYVSNRGRTFHDVGHEEIDLYAGEALDELNWNGQRWIRISTLRGGAATYLAEQALA
ncbi:hypothetical protein [Microbacterium sp. USHLN272]|uniref:hypothetical protein n=1 Tax=Microbacterium sp. USHLN272 TaxID=3081287 RepID=UPI003018D6B0